jgi:hypothetical protein
MSKRITLVIVTVAIVAIASIVIIMKNTGEPGSADDLSAETNQTAGESPGSAGRGAATRGETGSASIIEKAAAADKYIFMFFYADGSEPTESARATFRTIMGKIADKAVPLEIDITDPADQQIVNEFDVSRAPMPLVLAVAPNGAITGGFPKQIEEAELLEAFASRCEEKSLKALQERRLVIVSIQNERTTSNDKAMRGVRDFEADPRYESLTELVTLDPTDPAEARFLKALQVDPQTKEAITVCLLPPGQAVARFTGETKKETIAAAYTSGGGCGPNGCGPSGCGN